MPQRNVSTRNLVAAIVVVAIISSLNLRLDSDWALDEFERPLV